MRLIHVVAGLSGLVSGGVALFAFKGATLHRRSGTVFVYTMLVLSATGGLMAALQPEVISINVIAGALTFYMVLTGLLAVRRPVLEFQRLDAAAMLVALAVSAGAFVLAFRAAGGGRGEGDGDAGTFFVFGGVALLAALGDARVMRAGRLQGTRRLARHLWRMCFALVVAAGSFFLGQAKLFPEPVRRSGLLPIPVLLALATMFYWLWRVRRDARRLGPGHPATV